MKFAVNIPPFGDLSDARVIAELARDAERVGWDGFFLWDHVNWEYYGPGLADPWVALAAAAMTTTRITLGTMVTPLFRRRPAKLARETVTLQNLCGGRFILGVGLGSPDPQESEDMGEEGDLRTRARMTDESLHLLTQLWSGKPVSFQGEFYSLQSDGFQPTPVAPIPVWVAATHPFGPGPLARAARWQGVVPGIFTGEAITAEELSLAHREVAQARQDSEPFDLAYGYYSGKDPKRDSERIEAYRQAGVTWWIEPMDPWRGSWSELKTRVLEGPPK